MALHALLCDAIRARRLVRFTYDGYERVVEPYVYGVNTAGHEALLGWLVAGWTASETAPGWRMYLVPEMRQATATAERFTPRVADAGSGQFVMVHCRVADAPDA